MAGQAARQSDRDTSERAGEFARAGEWELNRRRLIRLACASLGEIGGGMALIANNQSFAGFEHHSPDDTRLIVRTERPLNLESPTAAFDSWLTPIDQFFVRSHFGAPAVDLHPWELEIDGLVERPRGLSLAELNRYSQVTLPALLQCSGNGRTLFRPRIPGIGWERGAVGHAEWTGVRLADILNRAGIKPGAAHVQMIGADTPPSPKTPAFFRSIPLDQALAPDTLIALRMNGEPLPVLHGGPLRLVVPGWAGDNWLKWLRRIIVSVVEAPGFYMQTAYRLPKTPLPPGVTPKPADLLPMTWMNVKSLITWPRAESIVPLGRNEVRGIAWTGQGHVTAVDFTTDREPLWRPAKLIGEARQGSWRQFRVDWQAAAPGRYQIRVRATDSHGRVQPEITPWNRSGYLWNGYDQVACVVV